MTELNTKQVVGRYHDLRQKLLSRGVAYKNLQSEMYAVWANYIDRKENNEERLNQNLEWLESKFGRIEEAERKGV